jgi:hypothetical protein
MPPTTPVTKWTDGLGYCRDYTKYTYDGTTLTPPRKADEGYPSCTTLSSTMMTFDTSQTVPDNIFWGCGPMPTAFTGKVPVKVNQELRPLLTNAQMKAFMKSVD